MSQGKSWTDCRPISSNLRFCWPLLKDFAIFSSCQNPSSLCQALDLLFNALTLLDGWGIFSRDRLQPPLSRQSDDRLRREKTRSGVSGPTVRRQSDSFHADIVYASLSSDLIAGLQDVVDVPYRVFFHIANKQEFRRTASPAPKEGKAINFILRRDQFVTCSRSR